MRKERWTRFTWSAVINGSLLLLVLASMHVEKGRLLSVDLSAAQWAGFLLQDLGFVLLFEGGWLLLRLVLPAKWDRVTTAVQALTRLAVYFLSLDAHTFFLRTGYRPHFDLVSYGLRHLVMLRGLLLSGIDPTYQLRLALSFSCVVLGWWWSRSGRLKRPPAPAAGALAVVVGAVLLSWSPIEDRQLSHWAQNDLVAFARTARPNLKVPVQPQLTSPPDQLYVTPRLKSEQAANPVNVVLVILESTGTRFTPPYASTENARLSPAIAAISENSVAVENLYTSVTHTSKALIGILCGLMPRLQMPIVETLEGNLPVPCLPRLLRETGYRTAFLQTALGQFENRPGLTRNLGFELAAFQETVTRPGFEKLGYLGMDEFAMLDPALQWALQGGEEPFFLTLLTVTPHHPYHVPESTMEQALAEPEGAYRSAIAHQDRFVGRLYAGLEEAGRLEDTLFIVLGDHGEAFAEHLRFQHDAVPYEEVIHTPLLFAGGPAGEARVVGGLRHHVDLLPSLLELLEIEWEGTLPGRSLFSTDGHERVISSCWYDTFCLGMREGDMKYVYHFGRSPTEVFDLSKDPLEQHDLSSELDPAALAAAEARMVAFQWSVNEFWKQYPVARGPEDWWLGEASREGS